MRHGGKKGLPRMGGRGRRGRRRRRRRMLREKVGEMRRIGYNKSLLKESDGIVNVP